MALSAVRILNELAIVDWHNSSLSPAGISTHFDVLSRYLTRIVDMLHGVSLLIDLPPLLLSRLCGKRDALGVAALHLVTTPLVDSLAVTHGG